MRENEILRLLCDSLAEVTGREVIPETWRDGCISVFLAGGGERVRSYVDGSAIVSLPVEVKMREIVRCEADRLRVIGVLSEIADAAEAGITLGSGVEWALLSRAGSPKKVKCHENGSEEYTSPFLLKYYLERERTTF